MHLSHSTWLVILTTKAETLKCQLTYWFVCCCYPNSLVCVYHKQWHKLYSIVIMWLILHPIQIKLYFVKQFNFNTIWNLWCSIFWLFTWTLHLGLIEDKGNLFLYPHNFHDSCQLSIGQVSYDWTFRCGCSGTSCPWNVRLLTGSLYPNVLQYFQWHERF